MRALWKNFSTKLYKSPGVDFFFGGGGGIYSLGGRGLNGSCEAPSISVFLMNCEQINFLLPFHYYMK